MRQSRRQAVANARRTASNKVNRRRVGNTRAGIRRRAGMRSATGQAVSFKRPAGEFRSAGHFGEFRSAGHLSTSKKAEIAVSKLLPFI